MVSAMGNNKIISGTAMAVLLGSAFIFASIFVPNIELRYRIFLFIFGCVLVLLGIRFSKG